MRFPPRRKARLTQPQSIRERLAPRDIWRRYRPFLLFQLAVSVANCAFFAATPLFRIYWVRDLGATGVWVGTLAACFSVGAALGCTLWGRWSRPERDRRHCLIGNLGYLGVYPLAAAALPNLALLAAVMGLAGFFAGGNDLMMFKRSVLVAPRDQRPTFMAIQYSVSNLIMFLAPLLSTTLADSLGTRSVLALAGGLGLAGGALMYLIGWVEGNAG